jgi:energy-coupling factor transport system ATP-binding protein
LRRAERTKVVIAAVLAMGCKILIFDEVDIGQDYKGCIHIMDTARELHSRGCTIIFVTHNMSIVCDYACRVAVMSRNGIVSYEK